MTLSLDELRSWSEGIARVVESIGDTQTPRRLCDALGNLVQADRLGVFVLRRTRPELERPYRTPLYPLPPLAFLAFTGWTLTYILRDRPEEGLLGLGIVLSGSLAYVFTRWLGTARAGSADRT